MLRDREVHATVPAADLDRARHFYESVLGFEPDAAGPGGVMYRCRDSWFLLFPSPGAGTNQSTTCGWTTSDIEAEVADLRARGVVFEEYNFPGFKTVDGIMTLPDNRAAWFKDSEGNTLGVVQLVGVGS